MTNENNWYKSQVELFWYKQIYRDHKYIEITNMYTVHKYVHFTHMSSKLQIHVQDEEKSNKLRSSFCVRLITTLIYLGKHIYKK